MRFYSSDRSLWINQGTCNLYYKINDACGPDHANIVKLQNAQQIITFFCILGKFGCQKL